MFVSHQKIFIKGNYVQNLLPNYITDKKNISIPLEIETHRGLAISNGINAISKNLPKSNKTRATTYISCNSGRFGSKHRRTNRQHCLRAPADGNVSAGAKNFIESVGFS